MLSGDAFDPPVQDGGNTVAVWVLRSLEAPLHTEGRHPEFYRSMQRRTWFGVDREVG